MKLICLLVFYVFFNSSAFSQEIQAELSLISPPSTLKEGDVIEGVIKVWPVENADLNEFKKLENMTLANALYITEVENVEASVNNADVIEAKLLFIVKRSVENTQGRLSYKGRMINIQVPPLKIAPPDKDPEDYYVLDQGTIFSNLGLIVGGLFITAVIMMIFIKRKAIISITKKLKHDPVAVSRKKFTEKFNNANKREDFEELYALREEWMGLFKEPAPPMDDFFKTMNQHQYKKNWNAQIHEEVKNSFDNIRRSLK